MKFSPAPNLRILCTKRDVVNSVAHASFATGTDFSYSITPNTISITDTGKGRRSVTNDVEDVLRKIEYWHQGSITAFKDHVSG
jgi:hypothetical protein